MAPAETRALAGATASAVKTSVAPRMADPTQATLAAQRVLAEMGGVGASLAVLVDGNPALALGVGRRDPECPDAPDAGDRYHAYSIAKPFIAAAALRLVERGALDLDAALPGPGLPEMVTLRRALNHTAGLPDYCGLRAYREAVRRRPEQAWTAPEFLAATLGQRPPGPPGRFDYSNIGYLLVRLAIERAAKRSLGEVVEDEVFAPLGVRGLRFATTLDDVQDLAPGWGTSLGGGTARVDVSRRYHPGWVSHGALVGDAAGIARALDGLLAGRVVGPAALAAMRDAVPVGRTHWLFQPPGYGLGLMTAFGGSADARAGHGGEGPGASTAALSRQEAGGPRVTAVALANTERHDLGLRLAWAAMGCFGPERP